MDEYQTLTEVRRVTEKKKALDPARLDRAACMLLEEAPERAGPAELMRVMEESRDLKHLLEHQDQVVRQALRIRRGQEEEAGVSEGTDATPDRIRDWLRIQFERDPDLRLGEAYALAQAELGIQIMRGSFETYYFYQVRKEVREGSGVLESDTAPTKGGPEKEQEPGAPPAGEAGSTSSEGEPKSPAPEHAPSPQEEVDHAIEEAAAEAIQHSGRRLIEFRGRDGVFLAEERPDGRWRLEVDVETDDEVVDEVAGFLFPLLTGITKERAS